MSLEAPSPFFGSSAARVLAVLDWTVDPRSLVATLSRDPRTRDAVIGLLAPAWLHGLDWVGDPTASVPCAERQLIAVVRQCAGADVTVGAATVGDPDPVTASIDALAAWPADQVVLCTRPRHFAVPPLLGLVSRIRRATGLPVLRLPVPVPAAGKTRCTAGAKQATEVNPSPKGALT
jgi:hypothetical protein